MNNNSETELLKKLLEDISSKERAAQIELLNSGIYTYSCAPSLAPDQPQRLSETSNNGDQKVYRVDAKNVQKYLDSIGCLVEQFTASIPHHFEVPKPEADLRFLEIFGDLKFPYADESSCKITAKCSINFAYSTIKCSINLEIINGPVSLDLTHAKFEYPLNIRIGDDLLLDIAAEQTKFEEELAIRGASKARNGSSLLSISASFAAFNKSFLWQDLKVVDAALSNTKFKEKAKFRGTRFEGNANFEDSEFLGGVLFEDCYFMKAPNFHGSDLPQNTSFKKCEFNTSNSSIVDVAAFRVLKAHFGKMRDAKHELMFYALEHRAERKSSENEIIVSGISWLYDEVSEYGASIERTVTAFWLWNFNFFLLFFNATTTLQNNRIIEVKNEMLNSYPALILVLQNIVNPIALFSEKQLVTVNGIGLYVASLIQSIGSLGIIALMLLAIRGRFRKGSGADS